MALQVIGIGSAADDSTGDPLRTAFDKVNDNFSELYTLLGSGGTLPTLTNGRVVLAGAAGITDDAGLTYTPSTDQLLLSGGGAQGAPALAILNSNTGLYSTGSGTNFIVTVGGAPIAAFFNNGGIRQLVPSNGATDADLGAATFQWRALYLGLLANGANMAVRVLSELTTIAAAATTDTTIQMPAGAIVLAVSVRVTTVIPTANNFTVGDSGSAARFSTAAVSSAATSTDPGTKAGAYYNASALSVRITPDLTPAANTGRVRVNIHYIQVTPATS